jgi:hypothetical protein
MVFDSVLNIKVHAVKLSTNKVDIMNLGVYTTSPYLYACKITLMCFLQLSKLDGEISKTF